MSPAKPRLRIQRVYDPPDEGGGARVLVDRLWPRGLSKEKAALALWLKDIAPSAGLRKWFGHDPVRFKEFAERYRRELSENEAPVKTLRDLISQGPVTLVYGAHDTEHNQARVLADYMTGDRA